MARRGAEEARKDLNIKLDEYIISENEDREKKLQSIAQAGASMIIALDLKCSAGYPSGR